MTCVYFNWYRASCLIFFCHWCLKVCKTDGWVCVYVRAHLLNMWPQAIAVLNYVSQGVGVYSISQLRVAALVRPHKMLRFCCKTASTVKDVNLLSTHTHTLSESQNWGRKSGRTRPLFPLLATIVFCIVLVYLSIPAFKAGVAGEGLLKAFESFFHMQWRNVTEIVKELDEILHPLNLTIS